MTTSRGLGLRLRTLAGSGARFARQVWAELRRVVWPDRRQAAVFTAIVLGSVAVTALLIWMVDAVVTRVLEFVLD